MDATSREKFEAFLKRIGLSDYSIRSILLDPVAALPPGRKPLYIYLDLNHWIALAKARLGRPGGIALNNCYQMLQSGVANGQLVLPLTATLYMEVANIAQVRHRTDVADVMAELSRFKVIAGRKNRFRSEVETALHARIGRPTQPYQFQVFGTGVSYAFDGADGPIARLFSRDEKSSAPTEIGGLARAEFERVLSHIAEYMILRGPRPEDIPHMPDYDLQPSQLVAKERAKREQELTGMLTLDRSSRNRLEDIVHARVLYWETRDSLPQILLNAGWTVEAFLAQGKEWISDFLEDVPSLAIRICLTTQQLKNASRSWTENDVYDNDSLGEAVPYCDIAVTEKYACDVLNKSGIARKLNTKVISKLSELETILEEYKFG